MEWILDNVQQMQASISLLRQANCYRHRGARCLAEVRRTNHVARTRHDYTPGEIDRCRDRAVKKRPDTGGHPEMSCNCTGAHVAALSEA
jgi:hypothetical protein